MSVSWYEARRLLCVRLDSLGDVLMTTPALRALRHQLPGRELTLLTSPQGAKIGRFIPELDHVWSYQAVWMKHTPPRLSSQPERELIERLAQSRFDGAVIFTTYTQPPWPAALLCYLANIPLRLAYAHENGYQLLSHGLADPEPTQGIRHEVDRQLDLVASIGAVTADTRLSLQPPPLAQAQIDELLSAQALWGDNDRWLVIHPGATAASRRYPIASFAAAARQLTQAGFSILITGQAEERSLAEEICQRAGRRARSLTGQLDLGQLTALLARAPLLLSNNTGPAHMAAALGTPVVDLYALTNPQHTPWQVPCRVLSCDVPCRHCLKSVCPEGHHQCLKGITPEMVVRAVEDLWQETASIRAARLQELAPRVA